MASIIEIELDLESLADAATEVGSDYGDERPIIESQKPDPRDETGWRKVVRNFTPSWFAINMGTGIVSTSLFRLPYTADWVEGISYMFFILNILLFVLFCVLTALRYILYPKLWSAMIRHPAQSLFLGCFPTGLATIINMTVLVGARWGVGVVYLAWVLWWIDLFITLAVCLSMPFIVMYIHRPVLTSITAGMLLPIIPAVVVAATGAVVADVLPSASHALTTLVISYCLWGIGVFLSCIILALYFHRLMLHSIPAREVIASVFIPIGPLAQGSFAIQLLGRATIRVLPKTNVFAIVGMDVSLGGEMLYVISVFLGLSMWAFAAAWMAFGLMSIVVTRRFPYNMTWWSFVFPFGVFALCTIQLADNLDSEFFRVIAEALTLLVLCIWLIVAALTLRSFVMGHLFNAPDLKSMLDAMEAGTLPKPMID